MISNTNRLGRFTSSKIHVLLNYGSRQMTDEELVEFKKQNTKNKKKEV